MRRALAVLGLVVVALPACLPARAAGTLPPTLAMVDATGLSVAMQNGIPVPSFDWQPRPRIDLDGPWRFERIALDAALSLTDRGASLATIEGAAEGRHLAEHDDAGWETLPVPGTFNPPPDGLEGGGWYRRHVEIPEAWEGRSVTLRFASANYVADVWVNGNWVGYHEGGATPFAFPLGAELRAGGDNVIAVRVHTIPLGTRFDVVPWGATDWWNYGGLTGSVWLESAPSTHVVRADVVPHLDAVDLEIVVAAAPVLAGIAEEDEGEPPGEALLDLLDERGIVRATIYPASVTPDNVLNPDPRSLLTDGNPPLLVAEGDIGMPSPGDVSGASINLQFGDADTWTPARPALYALHVQLVDPELQADPHQSGIRDEFWTTFGIRHLAIDPSGPSVLLNGEPTFLRGVGIQAETLTFDADGELVDGAPEPDAEAVLADLEDAAAVGADFLRAGHMPADATLLLLADRLGFAVWEEVPLYHATPLIFQRSMARGIPQQMLREMALRDMNRPSVFFHGFANESTGTEERQAALAELHEIDRAIDGTRLTGQASYFWRPDDPTHAPLDVAGFTSYHGVFYGDDAGMATRTALAEAEATHPEKPIVILEFGRWADEPSDEGIQDRIFEQTFAAFEARRGDRPGGSVAAATWWSLHDFSTPLAGIEVEQFGLFRPDGTLRPAGERARETFAAFAGRGDVLALEPDLVRPRVRPERVLDDWSFAAYVGYALLVSVGTLGGALFVLTRRGGRALARRPNA